MWNKERYTNLWINSFTVIDLKDLKVYEGVAENPDSTMIGDEESIAKLIRKEMTFAEATAEVSPLSHYRRWLTNLYFQGKVKVEGNVELTTKAFEARG